jgi:hypothetical protein
LNKNLFLDFNFFQLFKKTTLPKNTSTLAMPASDKSAISAVQNPPESAAAAAKNTSTSTGATKNAGAEWATRIFTSSSFSAKIKFPLCSTSFHPFSS